MSAHVAVVANPAARAGIGARTVVRAAERLRERGVQTTLVSGGSAAETLDLLHRTVAAGVDGVVVAGGDGTVHLAIQVLAGTEVPLGIMPIGTGNDMAISLGLRENRTAPAADVIAAGATRRIDLARLTRADGTIERYGTVLAAGFDARVNDRANALRWPRGGSRYTVAILREFLDLRTDCFAVEWTDAAGMTGRWDGRLLMATVGNGRTYGGGIPICPDALLDDGVLDMTLVEPVSRARLLRLLPRVYAGRHSSVPEVRMERVTRVRIAAAGVGSYADGDPMGPLPVDVEIEPAALTVFVPANRPR
ncbi:diacylglycerol kinase family protein [Microbacterium sp. NPDC089189]|uniref:diacylglycerol kinase family protein n=1 Tax=Microbacterium sp. NPDC089189 TaxID=3154972 RepID=UPI00341BF56C